MGPWQMQKTTIYIQVYCLPVQIFSNALLWLVSEVTTVFCQYDADKWQPKWQVKPFMTSLKILKQKKTCSLSLT